MTSIDTLPLAHRIRSFVLRAGRMTAGQERAWRELWPKYGIDYSQQALDWHELFQRDAPCVMEIGFGTGDALLSYAQQHPEHNCIGVEVHRPGVGHLLLKAHELELANVRAICYDAVEVLLHGVREGSLDQVHVFFPDPWHKKRHHKRRLIQPSFVDVLARTIRPGGVVKLATDWENYAEQMLAVFNADARFDNMAHADPQTSSGYAVRPEHRPLTRFERRGHRLGHGVWDLSFKRNETR